MTLKIAYYNRSSQLFRRLSDVLDNKSWWKGLSQLGSLFFITDFQCVQVSTASNLELHCVVFPFHNLDRFCIFSSCCEEKVFDFFDFTSHVFVCLLSGQLLISVTICSLIFFICPH